MTYPSVVASNHGTTGATPGTTHAIPLPAGSAAGDRIVVVIQYGGNPATATWPAGWQSLTDELTPGTQTRQETRYFECTGSAGSSINVTTNAACSSSTVSFLVRDHDDTSPPVASAAGGTATGSGNAPNPPNLITGFGAVETLWLAVGGGRLPDGFTSAPTGYSGIVQDSESDPTTGSYAGMAWRQATASSEDPATMPLSFYAADRNWVAITIGIKGLVVPLTADFTASPQAGEVPTSVTFTDTSVGPLTITSWSWDFGDGSTSTSQNPTHNYTVEGIYTVTLTVGDGTSTDTETKVAYISVGPVYEAPEPGRALIEIKTSVAGSPRWGSALWGQDVWASSQWVDVTPQSISAIMTWGSHSPELGVLAEIEAGSWEVQTYDPERLLDPGNPDSPYAADLTYGLPIRIRNDEFVVRTGICETIAYTYADSLGIIRATDNVSILARADVPDDTVLSDTLRARARDVISAAGLSLTVESDPPSGDPALAPRLDGVRSAWRHIADAAEQTLHVPWIDRVGTLRFRAWASPYDRGRSTTATEMVELGNIAGSRGLYSVVQARDEDTELIVERRRTPLPKWGSRTYTRDDLTPDAGTWADAVLADRSLQALQWLPGEIFPLSSVSTRRYAEIEGMERLGITHAFTDPAINLTGIVVGGRLRLEAKREESALWWFTFETAQTATAPLYVDDADPPEFLYHEDGITLLYPDG